MSLIPTNINSATFAIMRNQLCVNRKGGVLTNTDGEQNPFKSADAPDADKVTVLFKTTGLDVAVLRTVPNTLEAWQALVGNGYVEMVDDRIGDGVCILCNEEGLIIGLAPNFVLRSRPDVVRGPAFFGVVQSDGELGSISNELARRICVQYGFLLDERVMNLETGQDQVKPENSD